MKQDVLDSRLDLLNGCFDFGPLYMPRLAICRLEFMLFAIWEWPLIG
jgi:hypothetical protein